jgi:predicted MPP superfamily phosphohydrolase
MKILENSKLSSWNSKKILENSKLSFNFFFKLWKIQKTQNSTIQILKLNYYNHDFVIFILDLWTSKPNFHFVDVGFTSIRRSNKDGRE